MNALTLLKQDHGNVEELFRRFEAAAGDLDELARIRDKLVEHLSKHATVEEQIFYPALRAKLGDERAHTVLEGLEEHHAVKLTLAELEKMPPTADRFRAKLTLLVENVRRHVEEEESDLFDLAREHFTVEELNDLGEQMEQMKTVAPTRPHAWVPDQPPLNILIGLPVAMLDRTITTAKDLVGSIMNGGRK